MADVSKVNVNSTDYNIKDSNAMHKGVDYVTAGKKSGTTLGTQATAEGGDVTASGDYCHAEGELTTASGEGAHVEGLYNNATGRGAHAEGVSTNATNYGAHAEGEQTSVSSSGGHAEGGGTTTNGNYGHAEGYFTRAIGNSSHAQGYYTQTKARRSHAEGGYTIANAEYQHVEGKYNVEDTNGTYAHIIGGGTADDARKNIFTVDWNGNACDGTENRLLPFKAVSEAEYAALSQAEKTNGTAYFRYEANGIMREIQDNGSATSLTSGALPTGQTITSYLNSNIGLFRFRNLSTLRDDVLATAKSLLGSGKAEMVFYYQSNNPTNQPSGCSWGSYLFISSNIMVTIIYCDKNHIACTYAITNDSTSIDWHIT